MSIKFIQKIRRCIMKSSKKEAKRRSRAITAIIKDIGRDFWNKLSISEKNKKIKEQISKTKKEAKKERNFMKNLNRELKGHFELAI